MAIAEFTVTLRIAREIDGCLAEAEYRAQQHREQLESMFEHFDYGRYEMNEASVNVDCVVEE